MLTWDEPKRKQNIKNHGLDFLACDAIWDHFTITREDKRQNYGTTVRSAWFASVFWGEMWL
jgi:uncharacterized DUF497 family protein